MPKGGGVGAIFPKLKGMKVGGRDGLSRQFKKIMETANVPQNVTPSEKSEEEEGSKHRHKMPERSFHSLRHTFTSWLANADVAPELRRPGGAAVSSDVVEDVTSPILAHSKVYVCFLASTSARIASIIAGCSGWLVT